MAHKIESSQKCDPQSAIKLFILEKSLAKDTLKNNKRINSIQEKYLQLTDNQKEEIADFTVLTISKKFMNEENFYDQLFSFCIISSIEKNFNLSNILLNSLLNETNDIRLLKQFCNSLFDIIDDEFHSNKTNNSISASSLSILVELGIQVHHNMLDKKFGKSDCLFIENYIKSQMMSFSNINNEVIRIALVYYLSRLGEKNKNYLNKILSRFGQTLLEQILKRYFTSKNNDIISEQFLIEHLDVFLFGSQSLAEMSNSVLQINMLKYHEKFMIILNKFYKNKIFSSQDLRLMSIHIAIFYKRSIDSSIKKINDDLNKFMFMHLDNVVSISHNTLHESIDAMIDILSNCRTKSARDVCDKLTEFYKKSKNFKKLKFVKKQNLLERNLNQTDHSSLKEILLLAS